MRVGTHEDSWWGRAAVYQVYPRSFRDGNGDGLGDLQGVIDGLAHLESLSIDAVWLSPFYPSPRTIQAYDVSDPRAVDPMFGTLDDFARLVEQAHKRGLRVIVDVVPNHVSASHPWFVEALRSPVGSYARRRFHLWTAGRRENCHPTIGSRSSVDRRGLGSKNPTDRGGSGTYTYSTTPNRT